MTKTLAFLHTAPANIETFSRLLAELDPTIPATHYLDESLLADARTSGITPALNARIQGAMSNAMQGNADGVGGEVAVVLCTCSSIGASAEQTAAGDGQIVMRVDRAMAEAAVEIGARIVVAAALESTLAPTTELVLDVAAQQGRDVEILPLLCQSAWSRLEAGDRQGYITEIAQSLRNAPASDVILLAQASMADAAALCADMSTPILSSPRLGLEAAIRAYRAQG